MAQALVQGTRVVQVVPNAAARFPVAPPLKWVTVAATVKPEDIYDPDTDQVTPRPKPPVEPPPPPDPTPDTLDVVKFLIDEGIVDEARLKAARPDWDVLLQNKRNATPVV